MITEQELRALIRGIKPEIRRYTDQAISALESRIKAMEIHHAEYPDLTMQVARDTAAELRQWCQELQTEVQALKAERAERDRADHEALRRDVAELKSGRFGR